MNSLLMTLGAGLCANVAKTRVVISEVKDSLLNRRIWSLSPFFLLRIFRLLRNPFRRR